MLNYSVAELRIYKKERVIYTYDMLFDRFIANKYLPIFCSYRS